MAETVGMTATTASTASPPSATAAATATHATAAGATLQEGAASAPDAARGSYWITT